MIEYTLIRSRRKSVGIYVLTDGAVEVRAPLFYSKRKIDEFVFLKAKWINGKVAEIKKRAEKRALFILTYGSEIEFRGKSYKIKPTDKGLVLFDEDTIYVPKSLNEEEIRQMLITKFKEEARKRIKERVEHFSKVMQLYPSAVKISDAKTRWGSCSGKNSLNFSWKLILADEDILDYVVVHELAHVKEHNHSHSFWRIVQGVIPDYKEKKMKLRLLQQRLNTESWNF